jgi:hypothetical protein
MIYLGDGMTDVPCMKLVQLKGGHSIAVYPPDGNEKARQTSNQLILDNRVKFAVEADYREGSALDRLIKQLMMKICFDASLLEEHAKQRQAAMTEQGS